MAHHAYRIILDNHEKDISLHPDYSSILAEITTIVGQQFTGRCHVLVQQCDEVEE